MKTALALVGLLCLMPASGLAESLDPEDPRTALPSYLRDRGEGVPTSMFGTYVSQGELLLYPFVEYYKDRDAEYKPEELGYSVDQDFRGDFEASEYLLFLGYGLTDRVSIEFESALNTTAELEKSSLDPSGLPQEFTESGLGDVETQVNWLWQKERAGRPALFSYAQVVFPLQKDKVLIGTQDWEYKLGTGVTRGFSWGTMTARAGLEYSRGDASFTMGEAALEYLKRVSPTLGLFASVEGAQDEWTLITEAQVHLTSRVLLKLNSGVGLTSKSAGWTPETGLMFRF